jgi:hypothetical protein
VRYWRRSISASVRTRPCSACRCRSERSRRAGAPRRHGAASRRRLGASGRPGEQGGGRSGRAVPSRRCRWTGAPVGSVLLHQQPASTRRQATSVPSAEIEHQSGLFAGGVVPVLGRHLPPSTRGSASALTSLECFSRWASSSDRGGAYGGGAVRVRGKLAGQQGPGLRHLVRLRWRRHLVREGGAARHGRRHPARTVEAREKTGPCRGAVSYPGTRSGRSRSSSPGSGLRSAQPTR